MTAEEITVERRTRTTTIPAHRAPGEWVEERTVTEPEWYFPWQARCGSVTAIAHTSEGAVEMVEKILRHRGGSDDR